MTNVPAQALCTGKLLEALPGASSDRGGPGQERQREVRRGPRRGGLTEVASAGPSRGHRGGSPDWGLQPTTVVSQWLRAASGGREPLVLSTCRQGASGNSKAVPGDSGRKRARRPERECGQGREGTWVWHWPCPLYQALRTHATGQRWVP